MSEPRPAPVRPSPPPRHARARAAVPAAIALAATAALAALSAPGGSAAAAGGGDVAAVSGLRCVHARPWVCGAPLGTFSFRLTLTAVGLGAVANGLPFISQGTSPRLELGLDPATLVAGMALPITVHATGPGVLQLRLGQPAAVTIYVGAVRLPPWPGRADLALPRANRAPPFVLGGVLASPARQETAYLQAISAARRSEGVRGWRLPSNFARLDRVDQLFVLTDLERVSRGLWPLWGVTATLDRVALAGARRRTDPVYAGNAAWGSNWFSGTDPAQAVFGWMYDDGPGVWDENVDCPAADTSGCWGHRTNVLGDYGPYGLFGGASIAQGGTTELLVAGVVPLRTGVRYTWAAAVRMGARPAN